MSASLDALTEILTGSFDVPAEDIAPDKTLDELGVDSVARVELADIAHEQFGVLIPDDELTGDTTVEQCLKAITITGGDA